MDLAQAIGNFINSGIKIKPENEPAAENNNLESWFRGLQDEINKIEVIGGDLNVNSFYSYEEAEELFKSAKKIKRDFAKKQKDIMNRIGEMKKELAQKIESLEDSLNTKK